MGYLTNKTLFYKSYNILIILKVVIKHLVETILLQDHIKLMMVVISFTRYTNPKETFFNFDGDDVYTLLYKCNQYFDIEYIVEAKKLRLASYYLDRMTLYWL